MPRRGVASWVLLDRVLVLETPTISGFTIPLALYYSGGSRSNFVAYPQLPKVKPITIVQLGQKAYRDPTELQNNTIHIRLAGADAPEVNTADTPGAISSRG